jgi:hypothetical protein
MLYTICMDDYSKLVINGYSPNIYKKEYATKKQTIKNNKRSDGQTKKVC